MLLNPTNDEIAQSTTRAGHTVRPSWKVRNSTPEDVGDVLLEELSQDETLMQSQSADEKPQACPLFRLLLTDYVRMTANKFRLRIYKRRPHRPPQAHMDLEGCYTPTADIYVKRKVCSVAEVIFPFPNLSS